MSNLSQFGGGGVKSVQRGTITVTPSAGLGTGTATITAVTTSKAMVMWLGQVHTGNDYGNINSRVELTNATTVTAFVSAAATPAVIGYQVVEFN